MAYSKKFPISFNEHGDDIHNATDKFIKELTEIYANLNDLDTKKVNGDLVAELPAPNKLLKLNSSGKLPADITGEAATVKWENVADKPNTVSSETSNIIKAKWDSAAGTISFTVDSSPDMYVTKARKAITASTVTGVGVSVFTSSGTWTCPEHITTAYVVCIGGAGGGGAGGGGGTNWYHVGAGGKAGGLAQIVPDNGIYFNIPTMKFVEVPVIPGNTYNIVIGVGGNGGIGLVGTTGGAGQAGTATTFGSASTGTLVFASGGAGGAGGAAKVENTYYYDSESGTSTGYYEYGFPGESGKCHSGYGAISIGGAPGNRGQNGSAGGDGIGFGSCGAGGGGAGVTANKAGGNGGKGGNGLCIIKWGVL